MRLVLAFVALLAGCKKDERSPSRATEPTPTNAVAPADASQPPPVALDNPTIVEPYGVTPCPTVPSVLKATAAKALGIMKADDVGDVTCNNMSTPHAVWAIDANVLAGDLFKGWLALVDARDHHVVVKENTGESDQGLAKATITVADLDGDGIDELMRSATVGGHGFANETLHVLAFRSNKLVEVGKLPVRSENTGAVAIGEAKSKDHYECQSTMKVIKGAAGKQLIEIVGDKRKGKPPVEECPPVGRHVYAFDGKVVTETKAK